MMKVGRGWFAPQRYPVQLHYCVERWELERFHSAGKRVCLASGLRRSGDSEYSWPTMPAERSSLMRSRPAYPVLPALLRRAWADQAGCYWGPADAMGLALAAVAETPSLFLDHWRNRQCTGSDVLP